MVTTGFTVHKFSTSNMKCFIHVLIYLCMYIRVPTSKSYQSHWRFCHAWFHLTSTLFFSNAVQINSVLYNSGVEITLELHFCRTSHKYLCTVQIKNQDINTIFRHNPLFLTSASPHLRFTITWLHNGRHSTQSAATPRFVF
jgi:hypothetical protein